MNILALCGSLRAQSSNHLLLLALRRLLEPTSTWNFFEIKSLPYFEPELQFSSQLPFLVADLRALAAKADFIVIATPEYAHGIPGVLKNALEWLVCEETMKKPCIILIGSPSGGAFVKEYLSETLKTMDMLVTPERTLSVSVIKNQISPDGEILDSELREKLIQLASVIRS